uniref:Uncharacterized protein n=1 Tax=Panagrolaimus sp. ES5 TaxID=591445 RepID=A0AC34FSD7_9BILA
MAKCKLSTCTQQAIQSYLNINYKEFGYYFAVVLIQNIGEVLTKTLDESGGHLFNVNVWQKYYLPYFVGIQRYKEGSVLAQSRCNPEDVLNFDTTCILVASNSYNYVYSQMTQRIAERCNYGAFIIIISNFKSSRPTAVLDSSAKVFSIFTNCGPFNAYDWYITVYLAGS